MSAEDSVVLSLVLVVMSLSHYLYMYIDILQSPGADPGFLEGGGGLD